VTWSVRLHFFLANYLVIIFSKYHSDHNLYKYLVVYIKTVSRLNEVEKSSLI